MKTIYLVYGASGDYECTWEWPITTTLSEEKALVLTEEFRVKALELKQRIALLKRPELTSWKDPDQYEEYCKQNVAYRDAVKAIEQEHPVCQYRDVHVDLDADFSYEPITFHEE